jgi:hypothetical protein
MGGCGEHHMGHGMGNSGSYGVRRRTEFMPLRRAS